VAVQTEGVVAPATTPPTVALDDMYLTGGYGPDTSEPGSQPYDYRVTNFDPLTGAEGNPSDVMPTTDAITIGTPGTVTALRQQITVTPAASGLAGAKQRLYRRGGQNVDDWYFIGPNTVDGGAIIDTVNDVNALAAGALEIDHDQPVTSVDTSGNARLAQPVRVFFGLIDDLMFALGDINRPGDLYWSKPGDYDSWPAANRLTVCPPSEELMNGVRWGGQGFVFSRERGYSIQVNLATEQQVQAVPTDCSEGMAGYWCCCACPLGIAFVSLSGVRVTQGTASTLLSVALDPLFHGTSVNGYSPIDFTARDALRLIPVDNELWFGYKDTAAAYRWMVYSFITQTWRSVSFAVATNVVAGLTVRSGAAVGDPGTYILVGGQASGKGYIHSGSTDDGSAISCQYRSGAEDFDLAEEKLLGEFFVEGDLLTAGLTGQTFLNGESVTNTAQAVLGLSGYNRYVFEPFGMQPQHGRSLSIALTWSGTAGISPSLAKIGVAFQTQPETTMNRVTTWDAPSEHPIYLYGCWIDSDTGGSARTIIVEGLQDSATVTLATLSVNSAAGRRQWFSWTAQRVDQVRLRPSGTCEPWLLFGCRWIYKELPDYIAGWDTQGDILGDSYITGVDLVVDTGGLDKEVKFYVDNVLIKTSQLGAVAGKRLVHISFDISTPLRGHIGQILSTDGDKGMLYSWKWISTAEPGEQYNFNQPYEDLGDPGEKYITGIILECDTFNVAKAVTIEVDGAVVETLSVTANGRRSLRFGFASGPYRGYIVRAIGTDSNPGRLYSKKWLFALEPAVTSRAEVENFDDLGDPGDKYITGILLECHTHNDVKSIDIEIDGTVVETIQAQAAERRTRNFNFCHGPYFGKIVRLLPTGTERLQVFAKKWLWAKEPDRTAGFALLNFEDLGYVGEKYVTGLIVECDTSGQNKTVNVEIDGIVKETLTLNTAQRAIQLFHFPDGPYTSAKVLRLRPTDTNPGKIFAVQWLFDKEPADTAGFGVQNFNDLGMVGEKYLTGIILEVDTQGVTKTINIEIDGTVAEVLTIQTPARRIVQLHFVNGPYSSAKVVRLLPTDTNPGKLYASQWLYEPEPADTAGFGVQNWDVVGTPGDKWVKGVILECDTSDVAKTVLVERDGGTLLATLTVQANGRQVLQFSFTQVLARTLRLRPTDTNPGKLYSVQWLFDEEPFGLTRYETQELTCGVPGWKILPFAEISIKSTAVVTLAVTVYGAAGQIVATDSYALASTASLKQSLYVPFAGRKGYLYKFLFTCASAFWLYREESIVWVQPVVGGELQEQRPFGDDDFDNVRAMRNASAAAARSGGGEQR
jgi:hypothetical protein